MLQNFRFFSCLDIEWISNIETTKTKPRKMTTPWITHQRKPSTGSSISSTGWAIGNTQTHNCISVTHIVKQRNQWYLRQKSMTVLKCIFSANKHSHLISETKTVIGIWIIRDHNSSFIIHTTKSMERCLVLENPTIWSHAYFNKYSYYSASCEQFFCVYWCVRDGFSHIQFSMDGNWILRAKQNTVSRALQRLSKISKDDDSWLELLLETQPKNRSC